MSEQALSVKEKIGYGMGDAASHIVFDNVMLYMMFFYTDIFGIPAGFVGTMFLLARALDAISDPAMGLIADRTRSRWGKFRPWVLFGALPFGVVCVFAYSTPELSLSGKMIYAAVTYTLLTLMYTVVNIPYCALGGVITSDPQQRISLQSWRFVLATAGGMLSTVLMMPLVNFFGGEDKAFGFQAGIGVLAVVAFLMLAFCFFTTKERVEAPPNTSTMREDLRDILQNDQWRVVGVLTILNILAVCVRGGAMMYYVTWIMGDAALFSWFLGLYCVGNLFGSALAKPLTDWKCKVSVFWWTNAALAVLSVAMFFVPMSATVVMFVFIFVIGVLHQLVTPIQWVMMSDTVDYGEWRNGKRLTGISFAGTLFVLKLGLALGGALIGWMLAGGGYDAAAKTQNSTTLTIIVSLFTLAPGICYVLSAIIAKRYYTLKTPFLKNILAELAKSARHNQREFETLPVSKTFQKSKG
ncbi:glycoside-pentoside-hexuronide family transporter [Cronobacter malonaticus]|uniref:Glycoside-pentoside-hexuronide family transporter n=1 Tax=Cronobacter malonaticus TaxID=413503 RepID=A0A423XW76_9ENTR|nr:glycoside-pentoside-hexuronide family transporter [Cronobacter malonaticus]EKK4001817.1 glycoside-pentoside-hexuronide family transporter [Cronobacter sakazakii]EKK7677783.1 glycoside-pentoside-hexuronide family transporter [Cronobacter sakazakii]EKY3232190.1 glycoside-pentoside-hexuronide family transporter [Cronobacter malonaticus]ELQ6264291.1 glycoside-pentoside-hexuronide family transporter [Cronobacter malonaticus]ELY2767334.1 glycoside-pentoside-hexuronide family transporter [Cronobac